MITWILFVRCPEVTQPKQFNSLSGVGIANDLQCHRPETILVV